MEKEKIEFNIDYSQNNMMLGMSYTDQKENEHGYFKDIVDRTAQYDTLIPLFILPLHTSLLPPLFSFFFMNIF
jgi:hypothetical protein